MKSIPLVIHQGRTLTKPFRRRYRNGPNAGQVIDFPEHGVIHARLQVRPEPGGPVLLDLHTSNGGINLVKYEDGTGKEWSGYIYADAAATGLLVPWGEGVWDMLAATEDGSWVKTLFAGPAILLPATTTWEDLTP